MAINLPNIAPTSRAFSPPRWPTSSTRSQSGVNTLRLWGSQPSQAALSLSFANIPDATAAQFAAAHRQAKGPVTELTLPSAIYEGLGTALATEIQNLATTHGLRWFFPENDPPRISSVKPGISSVQVNLVGELRMG